MQKPFELNWFGGGYFDLVDRFIVSNEQPDDTYVASFVNVFRRAIENNFDDLGSLVSLLKDSFPGGLGNACACLIGCAGSAALVDTLVDDEAFKTNSDMTHALTTILAMHGRVKDAETLLGIFVEEQDKRSDWYDGYPGWISDITELNTDSLVAYEGGGARVYETSARGVIENLKDQYGENCYVFGGLPLSPANMKSTALKKIEQNLFLDSSRVRVEAYFGQDCTRLYGANGRFLKNDAEEIIQNFTEAADNELGKKYFFGYPT